MEKNFFHHFITTIRASHLAQKELKIITGTCAMQNNVWSKNMDYEIKSMNSLAIALFTLWIQNWADMSFKKIWTTEYAVKTNTILLDWESLHCQVVKVNQIQTVVSPANVDLGLNLAGWHILFIKFSQECRQVKKINNV